MNCRAIYPGTFDPMHNGHIDVAQRAAAIFDQLVVAVYDAPPKRLLFTTEERVALARQVLAHLDNVEVVSFQGLTVECARTVGAQVIVRGLRNVADFEFEYQVGLANRGLAPDIDTCCLICDSTYTYLSSTIVKEVASLGGDISGWVPEPVIQALARRFAERGGVTVSQVTKVHGKLSHRG